MAPAWRFDRPTAKDATCRDRSTGTDAIFALPMRAVMSAVKVLSAVENSFVAFLHAEPYEAVPVYIPS